MLFFKNNKGKKEKPRKKVLKSLRLVDLQLLSQQKLISERIGITFDNYLLFALRNRNFEASKYLLSLEIFDLDFKNSSGFTYFHSWIIDNDFELLKLLFIDPNLIEEPFSSKIEISEDIFTTLNHEIFSKRIFEITSNKGNTILNCCAEYGSDEIFTFLFRIFIDHFGQEKYRKDGKRILEIEDQNHQSVLYKCVLKNQDNKISAILAHKYMVKEKDLLEISNYLEGNKNTKLGAKKENKLKTGVDKRKINIFVNKIWNYLKDKNPNKMIDYIESRAEILKRTHPNKTDNEIYSEIVNDQK